MFYRANMETRLHLKLDDFVVPPAQQEAAPQSRAAAFGRGMLSYFL